MNSRVRRWTKPKPRASEDDRSLNEFARLFDVELIDYERSGDGIVLSSGAGIGVALMDVLTHCRYFIDIDLYRNKSIDWEAVGILLSMKCKTSIVAAGWFSFDSSSNFDAFCRGVVACTLYRYEGGRDVMLSEFIDTVTFDHKNHAVKA